MFSISHRIAELQQSAQRGGGCWRQGSDLGGSIQLDVWMVSNGGTNGRTGPACSWMCCVTSNLRR